MKETLGVSMMGLEMAQWLEKKKQPLAEDPALIPSTHTVAYHHL